MGPEPARRVLFTQQIALDQKKGAELSDGARVVLPLRSPGPVGRSVFANAAGSTVGTMQEFAAVIRLDE